MGYTTQFEGVLLFTSEPTNVELLTLGGILGEDFRDHPEWKLSGSHDFYYVDLQIAPDNAGLQWSGSEKSYDMVGQVNAVLELVQRVSPAFSLEGSMNAQGEEIGDVWELVIEGGKAVKHNMPVPGGVYRCPHCEETFRLTEAEQVT